MADFIIPEDINDIEEPKAQTAGRYFMRITDAEKYTKEGKKSLKMTFDFVDYPAARSITVFLAWPNLAHKDGGKFATLLMKRFITQFKPDVSSGQLGPNEVKGCEAEASIGEQMDPKYGHQNTIDWDLLPT